MLSPSWEQLKNNNIGMYRNIEKNLNKQFDYALDKVDFSHSKKLLSQILIASNCIQKKDLETYFLLLLENLPQYGIF